MSSTQAIPSGRVLPFPFGIHDAGWVEDDSSDDEVELPAIVGLRSRSPVFIHRHAIDAWGFVSFEPAERLVQQFVGQRDVQVVELNRLVELCPFGDASNRLSTGVPSLCTAVA